MGEGFVSGIPLSPSNLHPFGAPPSIGRRECPREPLPLEGAAERSEAGLAFFLRRSRLLFASPLGKALCREKRCSRFAAFPTRGRLYVGDSGIPIQPPPLRGTSFHRKEGVSTLAPSLGRGCRAPRGGVGFLFAAKPPPLCLPHWGKALCREKRCSRFAAFPTRGRLCSSLL